MIRFFGGVVRKEIREGLSGAPPVGPSRELRHNHPPLHPEKARHGSGRAGPWPVQLRLAYDYTGAEYVQTS